MAKNSFTFFFLYFHFGEKKEKQNFLCFYLKPEKEKVCFRHTSLQHFD